MESYGFNISLTITKGIFLVCDLDKLWNAIASCNNYMELPCVITLWAKIMILLEDFFFKF